MLLPSRGTNLFAGTYLGRRLETTVVGDDYVRCISHQANCQQQFSLDQNYPNPFNPVTNFQFSIVNRQLTILKVYDVLGREVATLVNEVKQPGTYDSAVGCLWSGKRYVFLSHSGWRFCCHQETLAIEVVFSQMPHWNLDTGQCNQILNRALEKFWNFPLGIPGNMN